MNNSNQNNAAGNTENNNKKRENKMKYIIIAVIAIILIAAVVIAVVVSKSKTKNDIDDNENDSFIAEESGDREPVSMSDDVQVTFENMDNDLADRFEEHNITTMLTTAFHPQLTTVTNGTSTTNKNDPTTNKNDSTTSKTENTTEKYVEKTTVKTEINTNATDAVLKEIDAFFKGKYYFDGTMVTDGQQSPLELAMNGSDFIVYSEMDGMEMGILCLEDEFYLINPTEKKYIVVNKALQNMMDIDTDSLKFEFNGINFNGYSPTEVTQATYNGKPAVCYTYKDSNHNLDFVVVNGEITQIIQYDKSGNTSTILQADEYNTNYSADMVSLKGYKKTNLISFVTDLMG